MFDQITYWHWLALGALLVILEILAPGVVFLWLGIAAVLTGIVALFTPFLGLEIHALIFAVFAIVSVWAGRRVWRASAAVPSDHPDLNRRGAEFIGRSFALADDSAGGTGHVRIGDTLWTVRIAGDQKPLAKGEMVRITAIAGAVLEAEPIKSYEPRARGAVE